MAIPRLRPITLALLLAAGVAPPASGQEPDAIDELLRVRAASVMSKDERAFRATMSGAPAAFVSSRMRWFEGAMALPITAYSLERDLDGPSSYPARSRTGFDETTVIAVMETLALGYDGDEPQVIGLIYTFARRGTTWSIIDDSELADVGLESSRSLWDLGSVSTDEGSGVFVIGRNVPANRVRTFIDEIAAARRRADSSWPFGAPEKVVALVPGTAQDLGELFSVDYDIGRFIGFASSTWTRRKGEYVIGGRRLVVNPAGFFAASAGARADILAHELIHLSTSPTTGPWMPSWLEEGIAQVYGERTSRSTQPLNGTRVSLPDDYVFASGTDAQVSRSYRTSLSFVRFLVKRYGRAAVARFQREVGATPAVVAGTQTYHLDRASRKVFKERFALPLSAWRAEVRAA